MLIKKTFCLNITHKFLKYSQVKNFQWKNSDTLSCFGLREGEILIITAKIMWKRERKERCLHKGRQVRGFGCWDTSSGGKVGISVIDTTLVCFATPSTVAAVSDRTKANTLIVNSSPFHEPLSLFPFSISIPFRLFLRSCSIASHFV